jgi:hypothetical protein
LKLSPDDPKLKERVKLKSDEEMAKFIKKERGLGIFIDTDLTFLWEEE